MKASKNRPADERYEWFKSSPFIIGQFLPLGALFTDVTLGDFFLCFALYYLRVFFITAGFHRYFAHRSYKMGRVMQFLMAFGATTSFQKGVLWWAGHHRQHHRYSDQPEDVHSPKKGFFWSHMGWIMCAKYNDTDYALIPDFAKYPELRWINTLFWLPPVLLAAGCWLWGGWSALFVGFFLSTFFLWHGTFFINSLAHVFGRRRYVTTDTSRNSFWLAILTMGEGWHNNHHHFQASANQGFFWWEVDLTYYALKFLSWFGLVHDLRNPPKTVLARNLVKDGLTDIGMLKDLPGKAAAAFSSNLQLAKEALSDATQQAVAKVADVTRLASDTLSDLTTPQNLQPSQK